MTDIKKINIYMGVVGQAYVDKETAKKQLEAAKKNVMDVKHIIYLVNHNYEQDVMLANNSNLYPLTAQSYMSLADAALVNAQAAKDLASQVRDDLEQKKTLISQDSPKYEQLINLINALQSNDIDMDYTNGGNVITADINISQINALITELNDILEIATNLLAENEAYVDACQTIYDEAVAKFEAYVPEAAEDQAGKSDRLEAELITRLNAVANGLEIAQDTTDAINRTSAEVQNQANAIMTDEGGQEGGEQGGQEGGEQGGQEGGEQGGEQGGQEGGEQDGQEDDEQETYENDYLIIPSSNESLTPEEIAASINPEATKPETAQLLNMNKLTTITDTYLIYPLSWEIIENDQIISPIIKDWNGFEVGFSINENTPTIIANNIEYRISDIKLGKGQYTIEFK